MTRANKIIANMPREIWPFCGGCGVHAKSAQHRTATGTVLCDTCVRTRRRPRLWRTS